MWQFRFSGLSGALALVALVVGGSAAARAAAVEVDFGTITPSSGLGSGGCTNASGDAGYVCSSGQTFTASNGDVLTANGYTGQFATLTNLTWKNENVSGVSPTNSFGESGLGQNTLGPNSPCDDPVTGTGANVHSCEAGPNTSVTVSSNRDPILDIIIGSVQRNAEQFQLFGATSVGGTLTQLFGTTTFNSGNCPNYSLSDATCTFDLTGGPYYEVGLFDTTGLNGNASDSLIVAVSVPAPPIGHGLLVVLAVGGLLFGSEALRKRNQQQLNAA